MPSLAIPIEGSYGDLEHDLIENEPPVLFPIGQDSLWGQMRKIRADYLQDVVDQLSTWYDNLDPETCDDVDIASWEALYSIPIDTTKALLARQNFVISRRTRGAFTRTRRRLIVEAFIAATFGQAIQFSSLGVPFVDDGIPFFSGIFDFDGVYNIVEDIPAFTYDVRILTGTDVDEVGLARELARITPAGITFTITDTDTP